MKVQKGQSLVIQVILFFTIGLFVFLTLGNFFRLQLDSFSGRSSDENRALLNGLITANYVILKNCKACDNATSSLQAQFPSSIFLQAILDNSGLSVASQPDGKVLVTTMHNMIFSLAEASGAAGGTEPVVLFYRKGQNILEIGNPQ